MTFESLPQIVSAAVVSIQQEVLSSRARLAEVLARLDTAERDHERWVLTGSGGGDTRQKLEFYISYI